MMNLLNGDEVLDQLKRYVSEDNEANRESLIPRT